MMKRWISMLLALMLLMLGMATAEDAADDAWEYELVGRAIELVRQMDAQKRGRLFEDTLNITEVACTETPQPIDRGMPRQAFISVNGTDKSASVLFFALMMMDASADTDATDEAENAYLRIVERTFAVSPEFGMDAQETSAAANLLYAGDAPEMGLLLLSTARMARCWCAGSRKRLCVPDGDSGGASGDRADNGQAERILRRRI